ncbi:MAG: ComEC/Rec2 family competence protein [Cyclobacteriaceae bacterium]
MIRWIPYTFVRTVLFFIGGILLGLYAPDLIPENLFIFLVMFGSLVYFLSVFFRRRIRQSWNPGWIALPLVFLLGYIHLVRKTESRDPDHLVNCNEEISYYKAVVTRFAEEKSRTWKVEASVVQIRSNVWKSKKGDIILYFSKEDFSDPFRYGDVLLIKGRPHAAEPPGNPGEFDYREFLALKNIYHQHFLDGDDVVKIGYAPPSGIMALAFNGRRWAETALNRFVSGDREQAIASALVLGVTDGLDNELLSAYAATGSMHILAVSGLHISILYFILLWILRPLNKLPAGRWYGPIIGLMILWLYAFVTGLSPSVLRAVTMFSFLALAKPWARSTNIYNTLAVSAFCLLLFDPFLVRSVGFQLSYLAVLGIVYLYPRILALWEPQHRITTEVWKISVISIAAQIATFPLGLLYFHQFPNYFLLSNLLVVPLSSVVLIAGLILLGVSFVSLAATAVGFFLEMTIVFLNSIVFTLEEFPFSVIENIYINTLQCGLLMIFILAVIALLEYRKFVYMVLAFVVVMSFVSFQWFNYFKQVNIQKITVYKVPGHSALDLIDHGHAFFLTDSVFLHDLQKIRYHVSPNRLVSGVGEVSSEGFNARALKGGRLIVWNGKKILQITDRSFEVPGAMAVDWVIIGNNSLPDVQLITGKVTFQTIVLDSSNSFLFATRFLEEAELHKLDVHSVLHQGAFISKLENQDT